MRVKKIIRSTIEKDDIKTEDGGMAKIATIYTGAGPDDTEPGMFIRIQSYHESEKPVHPEFDELLVPGKRIKITIEVY
jgi:hypothetical protein